MKYYTLLKNEVDDNVMSLPVEALRLSNTTLGYLKRMKTVKRGKVLPKFGTIRELVNYGQTPFMGILSDFGMSYSKMQDIVYDVELALARVGLKFADSEFTVGEVKVKDLVIKPDTREFLEGRSKFETLDDLIIYHYNRWKNIVPKVDIINDIEQALERFGLRIEGSPYRVDKEKFFPKDSLSLSSGFEVLEEKNKKSEAMNYKKLSALPTEEVLKHNVSDLGLKGDVVGILYDLNINTIKDLVESDANAIKSEFSSNKFYTIEQYLARLNLQINGSKRSVVEGKLVAKSREKNNILTDKAPSPVDVSKLEESEREKFYSIKVEDFGFTEDIEQSLKDCGIKTIKDIIEITPFRIRRSMGDNSYNAFKQDLKSVYGIKLNKAVMSKFIDYNTLKYDVRLENMSVEEKEEFLKTPIDQIGLSKDLLKKLGNLENMPKSIGELTQMTTPELSKVFTQSELDSGVKRILNEYGLGLAKVSDTNTREKTPVKNTAIVDVLKLPEEERKEFLKKGIEEIGIRESGVKYLKSKGYHTLEDIVSLNHAQLLNCVDNSLYLCNMIRGRMALYNLLNLNKPKVAEPVDVNTLSEEDKTAFLSRPLTEIGISEKYAETLKAQKDIKCVGDLIKHTKTDVRKVFYNNDYAISQINKALSKYGLSLKLADTLVIEKSPNKPREYTPENTRVYYNFSEKQKIEEEKKPLLERDIAWLGIFPASVQHYKDNQINTVGELLEISPTESIKILHSSNAQHNVKQRLDELGLKMQNRRKKTVFNKEEEEAKPLLERSLAYFGIDEFYVNKLKNNYDVECLKDLQKFTHTELGKILNFNKTYLNTVYSTLEENGIVISKLKPGKKQNDTFNKEEEEKKPLLERDIAWLGISPTLVQHYKDNQINTIEELLKISPSESIKILHGSGAHCKVKKRLNELGLKMQGIKRGRKPKAVSNKEEGEEKPLLERDIAWLGIFPASVQHYKDNQINTVGDLLKISTSESIKILHSSNAHSKVKQRLDELGLKMQSSGIYMPIDKEEEEQKPVLDRKIEYLGMSKRALQLYNSNGIVTIGDLIKLNTNKSLEILNHNAIMHYKIKKSLQNLGVDFVNSSKGSRPAKQIEINKEEEKKPLLERDISWLGISPASIQHYKDNQINTVGELLEINYSKSVQILKSASSAYRVKQRLDELGLKMKVLKGGRPFIAVSNKEEEEQKPLLQRDLTWLGISPASVLHYKDNQINTVGDLLKISTSESIKILNSSNAHSKVKQRLDKLGLKMQSPRIYIPIDKDEEEQKPLLDRKIECLGMSKRAVQLYNSNGVVTIGDLIKLNTKKSLEILKHNATMHYKIKESLQNLGVDFVNGTRGPRPAKQKEINKEEEKKPLLERDIAWLGIAPASVQHYKDNQINTVGELLEINYSKSVQILKSASSAYRVKQRLDELGLKMKVLKSGRPIIAVSNKEEEEKKPLLERDIAWLGISPVSVQRYKDNQINTVGELLKISPTESIKILNSSNVHSKVKQRLDELGLKMQDLKRGRKPKAVKNLVGEVEHKKDNEEIDLVEKVEDAEKVETKTLEPKEKYDPTKKATIDTLFEHMKHRGVGVLNELDKSNFVAGSVELTQIRTILQSYKNYRIQTLILNGVSSEYELDMNEKRIMEESEMVDAIISNKQSGQGEDTLEYKQQRAAERISAVFGGVVRKYYHSNRGYVDVNSKKVKPHHYNKDTQKNNDPSDEEEK